VARGGLGAGPGVEIDLAASGEDGEIQLGAGQLQDGLQPLVDHGLGQAGDVDGEGGRGKALGAELAQQRQDHALEHR
jgi:hypothetical protein